MTGFLRPVGAAEWVAVGLGGALGSLLRVLVDAALAVTPWSTLVVNVLGSVTLGVLSGALFARNVLPRWLESGLGTGLLGGFTTMSALAVQSVVLVHSGSAAVAAGYLVASVGLGVMAAWIGVALGRRSVPREAPR